MRKRLVLPIISVLLVAALFGPRVAPARAAEFRSGDTVVIAADEVIDDDLFISARTIEVNGTITGDLFASGTLVVVHGTVNGSAMLTGQTVDVFGQIDGSLYSGAYALTLEEGAVVGRNLFFGGYSLATRPDSQVERSLYFGGAQVLHDGLVRGDLNVNANAATINGQVGGNVVGQVAGQGGGDWMRFVPNMPANIETLEPGLTVGPQAQIGGQMLARESTAEDAAAAAAAATGAFGLPLWLSNRIGQGIGLLLVAVLLIAVAPRFLPALSDTLQRRPLPSLGWGLLIYLLFFPAALLVGLMLIVLVTLLFSLVTFGQYTAAVLGLTASFWLFALFAFLFFTYIIAWLIAGHWLGRALLSAAGLKSPGPLTQFFYVLVGVILFQAARAVPVLGFVLAFVVGTLALGAAFVHWLNARRRVKK